ncbi:MAG: hypothetical protein J6W72_00660 [Candidatus Methanomethylophilaceae archaeon]|nr:hypothetical protein [Candidatus Methanomethylophilaceae archaeon]
MAKGNRITDILGILWEADWREILTVYTDAETVAKMGDQTNVQPLQSLEAAHNIQISASVVDALPVFNKPGPITSLADSLAKAVKVGGQPMVEKALQNTGLKNNKARSVAAAFVMSTGATELPIKLSKEEKDFADYLLPFAKAVVAANGDKYRETMNTLLTASGSGEKV